MVLELPHKEHLKHAVLIAWFASHALFLSLPPPWWGIARKWVSLFGHQMLLDVMFGFHGIGFIYLLIKLVWVDTTVLGGISVIATIQKDFFIALTNLINGIFIEGLNVCKREEGFFEHIIISCEAGLFCNELIFCFDTLFIEHETQRSAGCHLNKGRHYIAIDCYEYYKERVNLIVIPIYCVLHILYQCYEGTPEV